MFVPNKPVLGLLVDWLVDCTVRSDNEDGEDDIASASLEEIRRQLADRLHIGKVSAHLRPQKQDVFISKNFN